MCVSVCVGVCECGCASESPRERFDQMCKYCDGHYIYTVVVK